MNKLFGPVLLFSLASTMDLFGQEWSCHYSENRRVKAILIEENLIELDHKLRCSSVVIDHLAATGYAESHVTLDFYIDSTRCIFERDSFIFCYDTEPCIAKSYTRKVDVPSSFMGIGRAGRKSLYMERYSYSVLQEISNTANDSSSRCSIEFKVRRDQEVYLQRFYHRTDSIDYKYYILLQKNMPSFISIESKKLNDSVSWAIDLYMDGKSGKIRKLEKVRHIDSPVINRYYVEDKIYFRNGRMSQAKAKRIPQSTRLNRETLTRLQYKHKRL
ncbi:MAG: hypothetical protein ACK5XN_01405 [Bacteroidota bacterium]|jgi:hypothetical protein